MKEFFQMIEFFFDKLKMLITFAAPNFFGVWRSWLAYLHGVQVVARSSRATPTFFL